MQVAGRNARADPSVAVLARDKCREWDSNPHAGFPARDFKSRASTSFAIPARLFDATLTENATAGEGFTPCSRRQSWPIRAGNGTRTRDPNLGKVVLYQLSYSRATKQPF